MTTRLEEYSDFFTSAFSADRNQPVKPFDYQKHLAEDEKLPDLLNIPTGAGKTNAVLGAWLWRRCHKPGSVGRRLIYCLPMRTLVEQTAGAARDAVERLGLKERFGVHVLYGGEVSDDWDVFPEREAIIVGTQDLLLSRALNRGYAMNRFRWAFHFGLFNNDCLWVFDEVQLFGDGLATTTQLAAMREKFKTFGAAKSLWMSATLDKDWLKTVDYTDKVDALDTLELSNEDHENEILKSRLEAVKNLHKAEIDCRLPSDLAKFVKEKHLSGTQTLIVVNTVLRAQEVFGELEKLFGEASKQVQKNSESFQKPEINLLHSRFRPAERRKWNEIFNKPVDENGAGRIIVATQVIEAGVDISSKLLITDIAPFASLVQRFGRINRSGESQSAEIYWVDVPLKDKDKDKDFAKQNFDEIDEKKLADLVKPYELESLRKAKTILENQTSAAPRDLQKLDYTEPLVLNHVLRQRDLIDLFDTTADLSGFDLDVSRFVRGGEERDVSIYWRENVAETIKPVKGTKKEKKELAKMFAPRRDELCNVPIYDAKTFLDKKKAWTFDALSGVWRETNRESLRTGMIILLDAESGGYDKIGWNPKSKKVEVVPPDSKNEGASDLINESLDGDEQTFETLKKNEFLGYTQTLQAHSREVKQAAENILDALRLPELAEFREQVIFAAHHHDLGKAHKIFQATVHKIPKEVSLEDIRFDRLLAKAKGGGRHRRNKFRHELASALALLEAGKGDLEIYLVAAHHGKVRLSIRALPDEKKPFELDENDKYKPLDKKFARGIWDGDQLPETDLGDGVNFPATVLNLDAVQLGRSGDGEPSWLERMINLRDKLGVFRLAFLEEIVRAADVQASRKPQETLDVVSADSNLSAETSA